MCIRDRLISTKYRKIWNNSTRRTCQNLKFGKLLRSSVECVGAHTHSNMSHVLLTLIDDKISCTNMKYLAKKTTREKCSLMFSRLEETSVSATYTKKNNDRELLAILATKQHIFCGYYLINKV